MARLLILGCVLVALGAVVAQEERASLPVSLSTLSHDVLERILNYAESIGNTALTEASKAVIQGTMTAAEFMKFVSTLGSGMDKVIFSIISGKPFSTSSSPTTTPPATTEDIYSTFDPSSPMYDDYYE